MSKSLVDYNLPSSGRQELHMATLPFMSSERDPNQKSPMLSQSTPTDANLAVNYTVLKSDDAPLTGTSSTFSQSSSLRSSNTSNYSIASGKDLTGSFYGDIKLENAALPSSTDPQHQPYSNMVNMQVYPNGAGNVYNGPGQDPNTHQYLSSSPASMMPSSSHYVLNSSSYDSPDMFNRFSQLQQPYGTPQPNFQDQMNMLPSSRQDKFYGQQPHQLQQQQKFQYPPPGPDNSKNMQDNYSLTSPASSFLPGSLSKGLSSPNSYTFPYSPGTAAPPTATLNKKLLPHQQFPELKGPSFENEYGYHPQHAQMFNANPQAPMIPPSLGSNFIPLQAGAWDTKATSGANGPRQPPYKPLMIVNSENIERSVMSLLTCKDNSNEYSPIFKADNRFNYSLSSRSRVTRIEKLLRTGGTTRVYQNSGLNSDTMNMVDGKPAVAGREILEKCVMAIYAAVGNDEDFQGYLSHITDTEIIEAGREPSRGVKDQLELPSNVSLIMDARHKDEIQQTFMKWTSSRPKTENFFRMEDKKGLSFSLEELKEALDIIMSRPPRRINNYVARQLLTDATYGQGRGVTEFNSNQINSLHSLSMKTRQLGSLVPAGCVPTSAGQVVQNVHYSISRDDMPFVNNKKTNKYDPYYCRRQGIYKEGWCGYCKMGGWYLMKNSGYLYHQNHEHGIFPGGYTFEDPLVIRRKVIRETRWEGLCGICYHWIDLDHTDRKLWGTWYRHYKLCVNEYEEIKKLLRSTAAPIELVEIKYRPGHS